MSWIKTFSLTLFMSFATIVAIDTLGYLFKDKLSIFLPNYGSPIEELSRGYPIGHFKRDNEIGFDITPNFKVKTSTKPSEYGTYEVWGNSYGCFDDEWNKDQLTGGIYLAGDSFTWGYARYEKKFGTLLEEILGKKVYACGVTHTGQGHQFKKFNRLFEKGLKPELVVVNVVSNDLDNDFFFPHTDIVDGFMVENIERCGEFYDDGFRYTRLSHKELISLVSKKKNEPDTIKSMLRQYSLSANIVAEFTRSLRHKFNKLNQNRDEDKEIETCNRSVYAGLSNIGQMYSDSNLTEQNRKYISEWINHSVLNGYKLLFSFIPSKDVSRDNSYQYIKKFIAGSSGSYSSFDDFCDAPCREKKGVYYQFNGHFNETGNEIYAQYLAEVIGYKNINLR